MEKEFAIPKVAQTTPAKNRKESFYTAPYSVGILPRQHPYTTVDVVDGRYINQSRDVLPSRDVLIAEPNPFGNPIQSSPSIVAITKREEKGDHIIFYCEDLNDEERRLVLHRLGR